MENYNLYDFSNFSVSTVRSALNTIKEGIHCESLIDAESILSNDTYWVSPGAKSKFLEGLTHNKAYFEKVKGEIDGLFPMLTKIEEWQGVKDNYLSALASRDANLERANYWYGEAKKTTNEETAQRYWGYGDDYKADYQSYKTQAEGYLSQLKQLAQDIETLYPSAIGE